MLWKWGIILAIYLSVAFNSLYQIHEKEVHATVLSSRMVADSTGRKYTKFEVINHLDNNSLERFIDKSRDWPSHDKNILESRTILLKEKGSYDFCINDECSRENLYSEIRTLLFIPGVLLTVLLIALFFATIKTVYEREKFNK